MSMNMKWVRVGRIGVDSGIIRMGDPCLAEPREPGPPQCGGGEIEFDVDDGGYDVRARVDAEGRVSKILIDIPKWQTCRLAEGVYNVDGEDEKLTVVSPVGLW